MTTTLDHCPTCGSGLDEHALTIMERNRNARDAQFREYARILSADDEARIRRDWFQLGAIALSGLVFLSWIIWASTAILQIKHGAR